MNRITLLLFGLLLGGGLFAQSSSRQIEVEVQVTYAEYLGTTPPLRHLLPLPATTPEKKRQAKLSKKAPKNFIGRGRNTVARPDLAHQGPDPVLQADRGLLSDTVIVEPSVNVPGLWDQFGSPHDPTGDIGRDHYVQAINSTTIGIFDKEGNILNSFSANTLWSSLGFTSAGDPIILYDQTANRWLITEFPDPNQLLVAVSEDSDPLGSWNAYNFATPSFPDYPKYGVWDNAYSVTTNEGGPGVLHSYFLAREALLAGNTSVSIQRLGLPGNNNTEAGFFVATPVDWSGLPPPNSNPLIMALNDSSWGSTPEDAVEIFSVNIDWDDPDNTSVEQTTVVTAPYNSFACASLGYGFACVPQRAGGGLDGIPETIMNQPHYRNFGTHESVVLCFMTDADGNNRAGIRWMELRRTPGADWSVYQEGTYAPNDGKHRYMSTIAMDGAGNIALGYNLSSPVDYVGIRYTGRRATDPLGEMTIREYVVSIGQNTINSGGRFGDYAHMSIDPTNDRTFWFTTEFADAGRSRTRIVAFDIRKDSIDIGPTTLLTPQSGALLSNAETVSVAVKNQGANAVESFEVAYQLEGGNTVTDNINFRLEPDSVYLHTFGTTVDMAMVDDYSLKVFTSLSGDSFTLNDTIRPIVSNIPQWDAGISAIDGISGINCGSSIPVDLILSNFGTEPLTSVNIIINLNGDVVETLNWTGSIPVGETTKVPLIIRNLRNGTNEITAQTDNPNGNADQNLGNDSFILPFLNTLDGVKVVFTLRTDNFPEETTWTLRDDAGNALFNGGPYAGQPGAEIVEEWCLEPEACYEFTINDSAGDGICCLYGIGRYNVVDASGNLLINSNGQFGSSEANEFCLGAACEIQLTADISPTTDSTTSNGSIMVMAVNGVAPYQYSIDAGTSFQTEPIFDNLPVGNYTILVEDSQGCSASIAVEVPVDSNTGTIDLTEVGFRLFPNPTDGVFQIEANGFEDKGTFLPFGLYDSSGKLMYESRITKYDDQHLGTFSLYAFPAGVYFVRFFDREIGDLLRVVKR